MESIRDFAFTYQALCKKWKPAISESEALKLLLKNMNPYLISQLHGRVGTVEELVRLGHQLEKEQGHQQVFEQKKMLFPTQKLLEKTVVLRQLVVPLTVRR